MTPCSPRSQICFSTLLTNTMNTACSTNTATYMTQVVFSYGLNAFHRPEDSSSGFFCTTYTGRT